MGLIDLLQPVYSALPMVRPPEKEGTLKKKLMWTAVTLLMFFILGKIQLIGLESSAGHLLGGLQVILASEIGTLISAGISPIVLSSIIL